MCIAQLDSFALLFHSGTHEVDFWQVWYKKWNKIAYIVVTNFTVNTQEDERFPFDQNFRKCKVGSECNRYFQKFLLSLARLS